MPFRDKVPGARYNHSMDAMHSAEPQRPASPDQQRVAETVRSKLPFRAEFTGLAPLEGDASNRRYFRIDLGGKPPHSVILMQLADPEGFKQSEEAVSGIAVAIAELPFANVLRHLAHAGVAVPALYHYDEAAGLLYLEDFGDVTLAEACRQAEEAEQANLYRAAVDMLVRIHTRATSPANPACIAFHRSFDAALLNWEFEHFLEYGVVGRNRKPMCANDMEAITTEFDKLATLIASQPRVFTHRDYHSRNLMVPGKQIGVLDFQDALLGPATYDLASLLRDAYREVHESLIEDLLSYYQDQVAKHRRASVNRLGFRRLFDLTSIQRNLKAAGRFVYIDRVKKNPNFLEHVPRTLDYVRRNLLRYPELATLHRLLARYVPELQ